MAGHGLIIGYGNPLRGDDGLGWRLAGLLNQTRQRPGLTILACLQLTPELAPTIAEADWTVLIDAVDGRPAGLVSREAVTPREPQCNPWTHQLEPAELLYLVQALYHRTPPTALLTVGGASFGYEERLSVEVDCAIPTMSPSRLFFSTVR